MRRGRVGRTKRASSNSGGDSLGLNDFIRQVFAGRRGDSGRTPLAAHARELVRSSVEQTGNGRQALRLAERHPHLFRAVAGPRPFPTSASELRPVVGIRPLPTPLTAIEFIAVTLLPAAVKLAEFQRALDNSLLSEQGDTEDFLEACSASFGFSAWLAGEALLDLASDLDAASSYLRRLDASDELGLVSLLASERFISCASSTAVPELDAWIINRDYPPQLRSIVTAWVHPTPLLSDEEIRQALAFALQLPAVDRWIVLQRCIGAFLSELQPVSRERLLAQAPALLRLCALIPSVFSVNLQQLLSACETPSRQAAAPPHHLEQLLIKALESQESKAPPPDGADGTPVTTALANLAASGSASSGHLAVLGREAVITTGTRMGSVLAGVVRQCLPLTESRASAAIVWVRLFGHSSLLSASMGGRVAAALRLRKAGSRRSVLERMTEAAARGAHNEVLSIAATDGAESVDEIAALLDSLLLTGDTSRAILRANEIVVFYPDVAERLPFVELAAAIPDTAATDLAAGVNRAVLAHHCARHNAPGAEIKRNDYFEDVLDLAGVRLPSDAAEQVFAVVGTPLAMNFFESVCVPQVMDTVPVGSSTEELLTERIRILGVLRAKLMSDADTRQSVSSIADRIELEMKELATHLSVMSEIASLDQRRVYVDTEGLRLRMSAGLASDFERFRRFSALDVHSDRDLEQLRRLLSEQFPDTTIIGLSELQRALTSESDRALSKMLLQIRDGFAVSPEFGLDGYLSGGIRHGNLEFHLREPFVTGDLLGVFRADGGFTPPGFSEQLISEWTLFNDGAGITQAFRDLASGVRALIDEVLMEWVQVDLDDTQPRALFQFSLSQAGVRLLEQRLRRSNSPEDFIDVCLAHWWAVVDRCLERARIRIREELSDRLMTLLRKFEIECSNLVDIDRRGVLSNEVASVATAIATAIAKLEEWFHRPTSGAIGDVEAATAVKVCLRLMESLFPLLEFETVVEIRPETATIQRRDLKHWVDIIHVLLVNAAEHGGARDKCEVAVKWTFDEDAVRLTVSNRLGPNINVCVVDERLLAGRAKRADGAAVRRVRMEGSSGLIKVMKYAQADLRCPDASVNVDRREMIVDATVILPRPGKAKATRGRDYDS